MRRASACLLAATALCVAAPGRAQTAAEQVFDRAVAHDLGQGGRPDVEAACRDYEVAADLGHVQAAFNAGVMFDAGRCGPGGTRAAATYYARAAAAGFGRAQFNLAQLYASGDGVPRNPELAAAWYRAASASGIQAAAGRTRFPHPEENRAAGAVQDGAPPAALPTYPEPGKTVQVPGTVTLVWTARDLSKPVRFYVELFALTPEGPHEIPVAPTDLSAIQVGLPADGVQFAWRVLSVTADPPHYSRTPWTDFSRLRP